MNVFKDTLRNRVERVQDAIADARQGGFDYEAELYGAQLADLLDLAARNDIDTTGWIREPHDDH